jgi:flavin-dependent dehydrogenase
MNPYGSGLHLDRALFDQSLRDAVRDACCETTSDRVPSKMIRERFTSVKREDGTWSVHTEDLDTRTLNCYRSKWMVDATGRKAVLARKVCIRFSSTAPRNVSSRVFL